MSIDISKHVKICLHVLMSVKYFQKKVLVILLYKTKMLHIQTTLGEEPKQAERITRL